MQYSWAPGVRTEANLAQLLSMFDSLAKNFRDETSFETLEGLFQRFEDRKEFLQAIGVACHALSLIQYPLRVDNAQLSDQLAKDVSLICTNHVFWLQVLGCCLENGGNFLDAALCFESCLIYIKLMGFYLSYCNFSCEKMVIAFLGDVSRALNKAGTFLFHGLENSDIAQYYIPNMLKS